MPRTHETHCKYRSELEQMAEGVRESPRTYSEQELDEIVRSERHDCIRLLWFFAGVSFVLGFAFSTWIFQH